MSIPAVSPPRAEPEPSDSGKPRAFNSTGIALFVLSVLLLWAYGRSLVELAQRWYSEADYNHGFFVPLFSIYLLYSRRNLLPKAVDTSRWSLIAGIVLVLVAGALRMASEYFQYALLEPFSLIPCLAGITLLVGGWASMRWAWPGILFLVFMVPLPGFLTGQLSHQLQRIATIVSTYALQTLGLPAVSVGNVIRLTNGEIGVVEACSGLRMLMVFFALTVAASFLIERPLWEKGLIILSAAGIALLANILRITATGMAYEWGSAEFADRLFHDLAGWLMMPLAMLILYAELWLLSRLLVPVPTAAPVGFSGTRKESRPAR